MQIYEKSLSYVKPGKGDFNQSIVGTREIFTRMKISPSLLRSLYGSLPNIPYSALPTIEAILLLFPLPIA